MMPRRASARAGALCLALTMGACGGSSPTQPAPPPPPPVVNQLPVINSITASATRVEVDTDVTFTAAVTDAETPVAQIRFDWKTDIGSITGTGPSVTLRVPKGTATPADAVVALTVVETYQTAGGVRVENSVMRTAPAVRVHDSVKEVGDMSRQFLIDFSTTSIKDWQVVMRNFKASACPQPAEFEEEKLDVIRHYTNFNMQNYQIGPASVSVKFGGTCPYAGKLGDACAAVPVYWDSIDMRDNSRPPAGTRGVDHISAAYSTADSRWWLCSSYFQPTTTLTGHSSYWR